MNSSATAVRRILTQMAYQREDFKNKVEEKVGGALLEYYKAALASLNHQTKWVQHWKTEADRLINTELVVTLLHSIRGFRDRNKAAQEVIRHLRALDGQYRRAAEQIVQRDYGLKKLKVGISDQLTEQFYEWVQQIIGAHT